MEMVQLRDGTMALKGHVVMICDALRKFRNEDPVTLFEAAEIARNPAHQPFGDVGQVLITYHLLDRAGHMYDEVRRVILLALPDDLTEMRLVDPIADR